jgi:UDP-N-acetylglucosamine 2-epimerase (non-hydrolysing)
MKILVVAGARPNFMKIAPLMREAGAFPDIEMLLVHTGQHYDHEMSRSFFEQLEIREPDFHLAVGSGSHAAQTARIMVEFEKICIQNKPDVVVVVGDVNSTLACSITARKLAIQVAHVEAGLRSGDLEMPEELNRIVTDAISNFLFVTEDSGMQNLRNEGKPDDSCFYVGNIMIDTLFHSLKSLQASKTPDGNSRFAVLTLHRPSNVDSAEKLKDILTAIAEIAAELPIHFPVHPRTQNSIKRFHLAHLLEGPGITLYPPLPYMEFLALWTRASVVFTDSGGLQEETTALSIPCLTLRENTERPITITEGTNTLVGTTGSKLLKAYQAFKTAPDRQGKVPHLWDGQTARRILEILTAK